MTGSADGMQEAHLAESSNRGHLVEPLLLERLRATLVSVTAPWWRGERVSANGLIYGLNTAGSRPPLFWCFQGHEELVALARALGAEQPLYGMRSGYLVVDYGPETLFHLGLVYAEEILSLGLPGPYLLGGNCQGGLLAQKTALALTSSGHAVSLLAVLNPLAAAPYAGPAAFFLGRYDHTNPFRRFHDADALWRANYPRCTLDILPSEHGKLFGGLVLERFAERLAARLAEASRGHCGAFALTEYRAGIEVAGDMRAVAGSLIEIPVTVRNTSSVTWAPTGQSQLWVGNHWRDADGRQILWLEAQEPLAHPVMPGACVDLSLTVRAPDAPGEYLLDIDMEHAGIAWLSEMGHPCATCRVRVEARGDGAPDVPERAG